MVEVPFLALVNGFVAAAAGCFAGVDERGDGGALALVVVPPSRRGSLPRVACVYGLPWGVSRGRCRFRAFSQTHEGYR